MNQSRSYFFSTALLFLLLSGNAQFRQGYYYDKDNNKINGLIKFRYGGSLFSNKSDGDCDILFKETGDAKHKKLTTNDINSFVTGKDSFAVVKDFSISPFVHYPQDFAKVVETGKINLYVYYAIVMQGNISRDKLIWLVKKNDKMDYLTRGRFKNMFIDEYINDDPELTEQIKKKKIKYKKVKEAIKLYNAFSEEK